MSRASNDLFLRTSLYVFTNTHDKNFPLKNLDFCIYYSDYHGRDGVGAKTDIFYNKTLEIVEFETSHCENKKIY